MGVAARQEVGAHLINIKTDTDARIVTTEPSRGATSLQLERVLLTDGRRLGGAAAMQ